MSSLDYRNLDDTESIYFVEKTNIKLYAKTSNRNYDPKGKGQQINRTIGLRRSVCPASFEFPTTRLLPDHSIEEVKGYSGCDF